MAVIQQEAPGRIIPILDSEFVDFESEATEYLKGNRVEETFIGFRLKQGVYGQRQAAKQMIRVKLPFGGVAADQLDALAEVAERYTPLRRGHITTRENIQYHHVPLPLATEALKLMAEVGLSTREACGNTVRNVTGDAWAGICSDEPFDVTPYAGAFIRYFVRNPLTQLLPRKFKVAFTASEADRAITSIHDLGFTPKLRQLNGKSEKGFRIVTGGGLSIMAKHAMVLYDFVPVDEYLRVSEAVLRIFERSDDLRRNRAKARIKFLVHKVGIDKFRSMVDDELKGEWARKAIPLDDLLYFDDEGADAPDSDPILPDPSPADADEFAEFLRANVSPQVQLGYSAVEVKVLQGDLSPDQFRGLAQILRDHGAGRARTTPGQNIVLRWIPTGRLYEVWKELKKLDLGDGGAFEIHDIVSCPGTDSCKLGITSSMGLNRAISEKLLEMKITDPLTRKILINASGCPNSCGQHHIAEIGFHGAAMKSDGKQIPAYHIFLAGHRRDGNLRLGTLLRSRLPAKRVPEAVERIIRYYEGNRANGEHFNDFFDRTGKEAFDVVLKNLTLPPEFSEESEPTFIDWERDVHYVLERGEGECAV